jgi:hypothetical protein
MENRKLYGLCTALFLLLAVLWTYVPPSSDLFLPTAAHEKSAWELVGLTSSQGQVFRAKRIHSFQGASLFCDGCMGEKPTRPQKHQTTDTGEMCDKWVVMTTIFEPTMLSYQLANLTDWCVVIVGDKKGVQTYDMTNVRKQVTFLGAEAQASLPYQIVKHLKWNHFSRKNLGYLYAIDHGASIIYDTDDDNILLAPHVPTDYLTSPTAKIPLKLRSTLQHVYNPYLDFGSVKKVSKERIFSWPRGVPLETIRDAQSYLTLDDTEHLSTPQIGVLQSLANHEPDVDSIFRLTGELPVEFSDTPKARGLPPGMMTPFNAQATLFAERCLWGLLLPASVHGRVSDIWRSYIMQRLMWDVGQAVAFASPFVVQYRNAHNYMADLSAEQDLFSKAGELIKLLLAWKPQSLTFEGRLEELIVSLYEHTFVEESDVLLWQAWIQDLRAIGYSFPALLKEGTQYQATRASFDKAVSQKLQSSSGSPRNGRIAVCVSGQPRTLNMQVDNKNYPQSWAPMTCNISTPLVHGPVYQTIQENLYSTLDKYGFDVFMYVSTPGDGQLRTPSEGDAAICEPLRPASSTNKLFCSVEKEKHWPWSASIMAQYSYSDEYGINGLQQQLYGMHKCNEMRKQYSSETGVEYDYVIRLRPDTSFMKVFPDLENLDFASDQDGASKVFHAHKDACCCGNEDWFGIGHTEVMDKYLDRLLYLPHRDLEGWNLHSGWSAEEYLQTFLHHYANSKLVNEPNIQACIVKPSDRRRHGDP